MAAGQTIVGATSSMTVIVLETDARVLPHKSVALKVSVTVPTQAVGAGEKVERLDVPEIRQPPVKPLLKGKVLAAGNAPKLTVIVAGAVIVGKAAGLTVIILETGAITLLHGSVS